MFLGFDFGYIDVGFGIGVDLQMLDFEHGFGLNCMCVGRSGLRHGCPRYIGG